MCISQYSNEFGHNPGGFLSCTLLLHFLPHHVDPRLDTIINQVATRGIYDVGTEWLHAGFMMWECFFFYILDLKARQFMDRAIA